jgi:thiopurine S-methyltransferase
MDPDFWHQRWREDRIGFHQHRPMPLLLEYWPDVAPALGSLVFVPLAGKSLDLAWLAAQGYRVLGVELSPLAIEQFFAEQGVTPQVRESRYGRHYHAGDIELICGDAFGLDAEALTDCAAVYDRAALIALPPPLRLRYVRELYAQLPAGCRALLITLEYAQHEMEGPPFSVLEAEVRELYGRDWNVHMLDRRDDLAREPRLAAQGVSTLETAVYRLSRKS